MISPKKNSINNAHKAFTLLEVLIAMAIVSTLSAVILANYTGSRTAKDMENNGLEVASALRLAQNYALTGYQYIADTGPCRSYFVWNGSAYVLGYGYKDGSGNCTQLAFGAPLSLKGGAVFSGNADAIYFSVPHGDLHDLADARITTHKAIVFTKDGVSHVVCVYDGGLVRNLPGNTCP